MEMTSSGWNNTAMPFAGLVQEYIEARKDRKKAEEQENREHAEKVKEQALSHQVAASRVVSPATQDAPKTPSSSALHYRPAESRLSPQFITAPEASAGGSPLVPAFSDAGSARRPQSSEALPMWRGYA